MEKQQTTQKLLAPTQQVSPHPTIIFISSTMASPSEVSETQSAKVEVLESANIPVIPFAVSLPPSTLQDFDDPAPRASSFAMVGDNAIVGSIVLLNNSVMVWVGWGNIDLASSSDADAEVQSQSRFGKGT